MVLSTFRVKIYFGGQGYRLVGIGLGLIIEVLFEVRVTFLRYMLNLGVYGFGSFSGFSFRLRGIWVCEHGLA